MTAPALADGRPYSGVVGVIDESVPVAGPGVYYVLTVVRIQEPAAVAQALRRVVGDRPRPFHYSEEGPESVERMVSLLESADLRASSLWSSVGRRGQVAARKRLLQDHLRRCAADKIDHLSIEGGDDAMNQRDQSVILDSFRDEGWAPFRYDWRSKAERLLWTADAVSGIVAAHLLGKGSEHYDRLNAGGLLRVESRS